MEDRMNLLEQECDVEEGEITEVDEKNYGYEKREVFYHPATGYYYDPKNGCYLAPMTAPDQVPVSRDQESSQLSGASQGEKQEDWLSKISEVSERMTSECGMVYDPTSGLYFDSQSGLYYDQTTRLYYSVHYKSYFYYDENTKEYVFHSQAAPDKDEEKELGDIVETDAIERHASSPGVGGVEESWPPCIRLVTLSSEKLSQGEVFVVTKVGANIGREVSKGNDVRIRDVYVSKLHAVVSFDEEEDLFYIEDCGSVGGTFVNGERLSESKERSSPHPLEHGDSVSIGRSTFTVHIHKGLEVCGGCLPQATLSKGKSLYDSSGVGGSGVGSKESRVNTLDVLKRHYGLKGPRKFAGPQSTHYQDRAHQRRKLQGSEPPLSESLSPQITESSSVQRPISVSNVGHQLLSRMGWEEGTGLGRAGQGQTEPMLIVTRDTKAGLGVSYASGLLGEGSGRERERRMLKRLSEHRDQVPIERPAQVWRSGGYLQ